MNVDPNSLSKEELLLQLKSMIHKYKQQSLINKQLVEVIAMLRDEVDHLKTQMGELWKIQLKKRKSEPTDN